MYYETLHTFKIYTWSAQSIFIPRESEPLKLLHDRHTSEVERQIEKNMEVRLTLCTSLMNYTI